ncbi:MAG TPA: Ni/Fe hydrogenase [Chromatiaceae bacterium]|jgi:urease accessory protein|nr:MAG: hypothetical protein N838_03810 [Thiohalocapsa sp. PB-PSB1]QQO52207.1 MAG: HupE/UreJ family protein [Thiohalocapsa sp. PB-PSB1]HBG96335.1 Ni/Fe hydrogenase [Chromatiaceae bacterium]HCS90169.1 Ni/Fe hydrogenase [Chromatiaceae bacterium]
MSIRTVDASMPLVVALLAAIPGVAMAHAGAGLTGGFASGFTHPIFGLDHLVVMVAVGLWGAQLGRPAIWLLPITFPVVMALGAVLGIAGMPMPFVEFGIALSALVLGIMVATGTRPPMGVAAILVGCFALLHGYAHGAELPQAVNALAYAVGFVIATSLLHVAGILIGIMLYRPVGARLVRVGGAAIAAIGGWFVLVHAGMMA